MLVLEDVPEVDDLAGLAAGGEHGNLVKDLGRAVDAAAHPGGELGRVLHPALSVGALAHCGKQPAEK